MCPKFLETLSKEHFRNGMAEVIKSTIIWNKELFFDLLEDKISLLEIIRKTTDIKLSIVE